MQEQQDNILTNIKLAKQYIDKAFDSCIANFKQGKSELECLEALEGTATDLAYESWALKIDIWVAMGKLDNWPQHIGSFLGKRSIPDVK